MKLLGLIPIFWLCISVNAQQADLEFRILDKNTNDPLFGATAYIAELNLGSSSDVEGLVVFSDVPDGTYSVSISFLGYETSEVIIEVPQKEIQTIYLEPDEHQLEEVYLQSSRSTRTVKKIPTRIEFIGGEELEEKSMMNSTNISMVLRESTGIQMQQTSLSSGNANIRIQGLDGRYTQILRDGFPLYGGFSSGLSIMQIPPLDLKQFEIIKGSASTLYGGGAIAGLVNLVSKRPEEEPNFEIMFTQTHALGSTANVFYSAKKGKLGLTLYGSGNYQVPYDPEDDGFSNLPKTKTFTLNPKLYYTPDDRTEFWLGINATIDDRIGGDMSSITDGNSEQHQYTEDNLSKRISSQLVYSKQLDSLKSFNVKNSISYFNRELVIPDSRFAGEQWSSFSEINYTFKNDLSDWIVGANLYTSDFDESDQSSLNRDQKDITIGAFAKNIHDFSENWILETGFRIDAAKDWGVFPLPKVSLLYKNGSFSSRIGGGLGYKIPDIFIEEAEFVNFENVQGIDKDLLEAERSFGSNVDFNYQNRLFESIGFSVNQLFYITSIKNGLLLSEEQNGLYSFTNADGPILSKGAETNVKFTYGDFRWFLNYAYIDAKLKYLDGNPQKPLTPKHNAGSVIMYENEKWRIGFETYYKGVQLLPNGEKTNDFVTMGLLVMKNFGRINAYMNFENFTDRRQSRFSPLVLPPHDNPSFPAIYAPTDGFIFSAGIILKVLGKDEH